MKAGNKHPLHSTLTFHSQMQEKRDLLEYAAAQAALCLNLTSDTALELLHSRVYHPYS